MMSRCPAVGAGYLADASNAAMQHGREEEFMQKVGGNDSNEFI